MAKASSRSVLGTRVDVTDYATATRQILDWSDRAEGRIVCCACVHSVIESQDDPEFGEILRTADMVTMDGMPLVWAARSQGVLSATRVYGPDLMRWVLAAAAGSATPVGFYGTTAETLEKLSAAVKRTHPELVIAYASAPPFEQLNRTEERETARQIRESGARILFVGLGCPKQEHWMARHREDVPAVMLGVGAAFDFIAGTKRQAPRRMQQMGCEWLFRLVTEPRRLAGRYFRSNPRFLWHWGIDLVRGRLGAGI